MPTNTAIANGLSSSGTNTFSLGTPVDGQLIDLSTGKSVTFDTSGTFAGIIGGGSTTLTLKTGIVIGLESGAVLGGAGSSFNARFASLPGTVVIRGGMIIGTSCAGTMFTTASTLTLNFDGVDVYGGAAPASGVQTITANSGCVINWTGNGYGGTANSYNAVFLNSGSTVNHYGNNTGGWGTSAFAVVVAGAADYRHTGTSTGGLTSAAVSLTNPATTCRYLFNGCLAQPSSRAIPVQKTGGALFLWTANQYDTITIGGRTLYAVNLKESAMDQIEMVWGGTSKTLTVFLQDSSSNIGAGLSGLTSGTSGLAVAYRAEGQSAATTVTLSAGTLGTWSSGGFVAGPIAGLYEIGIPNAALAVAGASWVEISVSGAANLVPKIVRIRLTQFDMQTATPTVKGGTNPMLLGPSQTFDQVGSISGNIGGKVLGGGAGTITGVGARAQDESGLPVARAAQLDAVMYAQVRLRTVIPEQLEIPETGESFYPIVINSFSTSGMLTDCDSLPTVHVYNSSGGQEDDLLGTVTNLATGIYICNFTVPSGTDPKFFRFSVAGTMGGDNLGMTDYTWTVNDVSVDFTSDDRTTLQTINSTTAALPTLPDIVAGVNDEIDSRHGEGTYQGGGTAPAASENAAAVLDALTEDHQGAGTIGKAIADAAAGGGGGGSPTGPGADAVTVEVLVSGQPVSDADVWITSDAGGATVVAGTLQTNSEGRATFMLDAGVTYYLWAQKDGINAIQGASFTAEADE